MVDNIEKNHLPLPVFYFPRMREFNVTGLCVPGKPKIGWIEHKNRKILDIVVGF